MIEVLNQQKRYPVDPEISRVLLKKLIKYYQLKDPEITLAFVTNKVIKNLHFRFLQKNTPTDVLSFPIGEKNVDGKYYLGDIIISAPKAFQQGTAQGHGLDREIELLTIHGFLHLCGFEHFQGLEEEEEKVRNIMLAGKNGD